MGELGVINQTSTGSNSTLLRWDVLHFDTWQDAVGTYAGMILWEEYNQKTLWLVLESELDAMFGMHIRARTLYDVVGDALLCAVWSTGCALLQLITAPYTILYLIYEVLCSVWWCLTMIFSVMPYFLSFVRSSCSSRKNFIAFLSSLYPTMQLAFLYSLNFTFVFVGELRRHLLNTESLRLDDPCLLPQAHQSRCFLYPSQRLSLVDAIESILGCLCYTVTLVLAVVFRRTSSTNFGAPKAHARRAKEDARQKASIRRLITQRARAQEQERERDWEQGRGSSQGYLRQCSRTEAGKSRDVAAPQGSPSSLTRKNRVATQDPWGPGDDGAARDADVTHTIVTCGSDSRSVSGSGSPSTSRSENASETVTPILRASSSGEGHVGINSPTPSPPDDEKEDKSNEIKQEEEKDTIYSSPSASWKRRGQQGKMASRGKR